MMKSILCSLALLVLAGCSNYDRFSGEPVAYQAPAPQPKTDEWRKTCSGERCRVEIFMQGRGDYSLTVYAAYNHNELVIGMKMPRQAGNPTVILDGRPQKGVAYLGCDDVDCKVLWRLSARQKSALFRSEVLQVRYPLVGRPDAIFEFVIDTAPFKDKLAELG